MFSRQWVIASLFLLCACVHTNNTMPIAYYDKSVTYPEITLMINNAIIAGQRECLKNKFSGELSSCKTNMDHSPIKLYNKIKESDMFKHVYVITNPYQKPHTEWFFDIQYYRQFLDDGLNQVAALSAVVGGPASIDNEYGMKVLVYRRGERVKEYDFVKKANNKMVLYQAFKDSDEHVMASLIADLFVAIERDELFKDSVPVPHNQTVPPAVEANI